MLTLHVIVSVVSTRKAILLLATLTAGLCAEVLHDIMLLPFVPEADSATGHWRDASCALHTAILFDMSFDHFATSLISIRACLIVAYAY